MGRIKIIISPEYENNIALGSFAKELPSIFNKEGDTLYADRNRIKQFVVDESDSILKKVVVKRYKFPNIIQRIVYSFFRQSKAKRAFHNAIKLRGFGIDTPKEIAFLEEWKNGLFAYGYYLSGYNNAPAIRERMNREDFDAVMAEDFARFAAELHKKGILFHDLNSTNVLYHPQNDGHYRFSLIDINRMNFCLGNKEISKKDCFENLTRFTGKMDLFKFVIRCYVKERNWDMDVDINQGIAIKKKHDKHWKQRKAFLRKITLKK